MADWERPIEALSSSGVKELRRLQAENAKLRELVHDMFISATFWFDHFSSERRYRDRIRELGIDVDDARSTDILIGE